MRFPREVIWSYGLGRNIRTDPGGTQDPGVRAERRIPPATAISCSLARGPGCQSCRPWPIPAIRGAGHGIHVGQQARQLPGTGLDAPARNNLAAPSANAASPQPSQGRQARQHVKLSPDRIAALAPNALVLFEAK